MFRVYLAFYKFLSTAVHHLFNWVGEGKVQSGLGEYKSCALFAVFESDKPIRTSTCVVKYMMHELIKQI